MIWWGLSLVGQVLLVLLKGAGLILIPWWVVLFPVCLVGLLSPILVVVVVLCMARRKLNEEEEENQI